MIKGRPKDSREIASAKDEIKLRDEDSGDHEDEEDEDEDDQSNDVSASKNKNKVKSPWLPFGDSHRAKVTAVRCKP